MPVEVATVTPSEVLDRFSAVGTVEAGEWITVVSENDALVLDLPFAEGVPIAKGSLIAQLDDSQLKAERTRAEALLEQNRRNHERIRSLREKGALAQQELDDAAADLRVAEADLELAEARLKKSRITAPFSGIVGARQVSPGAFARSGTSLTQLAQVDELKVTFSAPERYLGQLVKGAPVIVSTPAFPGYELTGRIDVIEPVLDPVTRSTRILARVRNSEGKLKPGQSANIDVVLSRRSDALTIPNEAVFVEGNQPFVFVIKPDSTVARNAISLGTRGPETVEVLSGIESGARIVRAGHQKLFEGAKVMPVSPAGPGS
jgi:membrane fusion protein (multidrug efflux system)